MEKLLKDLKIGEEGIVKRVGGDGAVRRRLFDMGVTPGAPVKMRKLDIATPVVLPQHFLNFVRFHNCRFYENDFVESFPYERFVVEDCGD